MGQKPAKQDERLEKLFKLAVSVFGSEEEVRARLKDGSLKIRLPRQRVASGKQSDRCGAHSRSTGKPCRAPGNGRGGRCKLHGGMSTGPRTSEGLRRLEEAVKARWRLYCAARGEVSKW